MENINKNYISLNKSELFEGLPSNVSKELAARARSNVFLSGDVMFFEGDPIKQVMLLTEGLAKKSQLSQCGQESILRLIIPGEVISEHALVPGGIHSSTAQALQDCKVLAWDSATFETISTLFPGLRANAHRILEERLAELQCRFRQVSTRTASPRLAFGLLHLMDRLGQKVNSHIEINVSQEVLGQMTAMTSFQVCNLLNHWKGQGLVKLRKKTLEIHCVPGLLELSRVK